MLEYDFVLWLLIIIPAVYLGAPISVRFAQKLAAHPAFDSLNFDRLDPSIAEFLMSQSRALFEVGFDEPTLVQIPKASSHAIVYLVLLINRHTGDKATVTAMIVPALGRRILYFEFSTRFESGLVFDTHNIPELLFPPGREKVRTQVPQMQDAKELFKLHRYVMDKHGADGKKVTYEPGQALEYLARFTFLESYENYAKRGLMYYDQNTDCYRPTWKGAFLMTWALMQPIKALRKAALRNRARAILAELEQRTSG